MALFWISAVLCALTIGGFFYFFYQFKKARDLTSIDRHYFLVFIGCIGAFTLFSLMAGFGIKLWNNFPMNGADITRLIFGSLLFGVSFMTLLETFVLYYYKQNLDEKTRKLIRRLMFISIPVVVVFFIMSLDAYAPYASFPLISGISFTNHGIVFQTGGMTEGFTINWYGVIILSGAIIAYFICDHHFYQEYKRHGLIDTLFILVFLIGILGARLWAVYILPSERGVEFWNFQSGGLGIMGGVLFGGVAGIIFLIIFRRYINLRHAMDLILPCVLVAQAIGRWGNFFNQEVYGYVTFDPNTVWWLPTFVVRQMTLSDGLMALPLFFIECVTNLIGYFVIVYAVGKGLKKHLSFGDLFCLYLVWYGLTRVILEPLRDANYINQESVITAWVMFGGGVGGIIGLHLYDYFRWGKKTFVITEQTYDPKCPYYVRPVEVKKDETIKN